LRSNGIVVTFFSAGGFPHNLKYAFTHLTQLIYIRRLPLLSSAILSLPVAFPDHIFILPDRDYFFFILFAIRGMFGSIA